MYKRQGVAANRSQAGGSSLALPAFTHGRVTEVAQNVHLLDTYHPSRQNTNPGRLTEEMLDDVLTLARQLLAR